MIDIKNKIVLGTGLIFSISMAVIGLLLYTYCTDDLLCVGLIIIPILPGVLLNLEGVISILVSLIFWFLIGALIGLLISKLKK